MVKSQQKLLLIRFYPPKQVNPTPEKMAFKMPKPPLSLDKEYKINEITPSHYVDTKDYQVKNPENSKYPSYYIPEIENCLWKLLPSWIVEHNQAL